MKMKKICIIGVVLFFTGCSVQKPLVKEQFTANVVGPAFVVNEEYQPQAWEDVFSDQPLQALITEALANNADVGHTIGHTLRNIIITEVEHLNREVT